MAITPEQQKALMGRLNSNRVQTRKQGGSTLSYLEAWDVRATLIRIFGFGGFSAVTSEAQILRVEDRVPRLIWKDGKKVGEHEVEFHDDGVVKFGSANFRVTAMAKVTLTVHGIAPGGGDAVYAEYAVSSQTGPDIGEVTDFAIKGLSLDTPIPTPEGWTTMGEVAVGDTVFDMNGDPTLVVVKSDVKNLPCYRVTFGDGRQIVCDEEHFWYARNGKGSPLGVHSIQALYETRQAGGSVSIPLNGPLHTQERSLPVDPWTLGYWLGNGDAQSGRVTCGEGDVSHVAQMVLAGGHEVGTVAPDPRSAATSIRVGPAAPGSRHGLTRHLREAGLLGQKMIPMEYLRASATQRLALLGGLMDADGSVSNGRPVFTSTSRVLAEQVAELVHSLGDRPSITASQRYGYGKTATLYCVTWTPSLNPFRMERKAAKVRLRVKSGSNRVRSIERIDSVPTQCIGVASETKSYLAGEGMVPTHNTAESDALKRCAINLGTQFGLGLYDDGSFAEVIRVVFAPEQRWPVPSEQGPGAPAVGTAENPARTVEEAQQMLERAFQGPMQEVPADGA